MYSTFTIVLKKGKKIVSERTIEVETHREYGRSYDNALDVYRSKIMDFADHSILCHTSYTIQLKERKEVLKTFKIISIIN